MNNGQPLRFSRLKLMGMSPAHFHADAGYTTAAMTVGRAAHSLILGGPRVVGYTEGKSRRGKEYDAWAADQEPGTIILSAREATDAHGMANAVFANREAVKALDGVREKTIHWTDPMLGPCRGTPDVLGADFITELKSGETSDPRRFTYKLMQFSYHAQLAWYADGAFMAAPGTTSIQSAGIVAVEQRPPHVVTVFRVGNRTIEQGRKLIRLWSEKLKVCMDSNEWPGYAIGQVDLELPEQDNGLIFPDDESETT